jgi:hypothetical protein
MGGVNMVKLIYKLLLLFPIIFLASCDRIDPPFVTATWLSDLTGTTATLESYVLTDGGSPVTSRGVCWSTSENPTIKDDKASTTEKGIGAFSVGIKGLTPLTAYYARAWATNRTGTGYGSQIAFTTTRHTVMLSTENVASVTNNSAVSGGDITAESGAIITAKGVCWGKSLPPTLNDNKTSDGTGLGRFSSKITGLEPGTTYYVRSYAICDDFVEYGWIETFETYDGSLIDADMNVYYSIKIGNQEWMYSNLKVTKYNNGELIGTTTPPALDIQALESPSYQWPSAGNEINVTTFGRLYTWYTATDSRRLCPAGWHLPGKEEWSILADSIIGGHARRFTPDFAGLRPPDGKFSQYEETARWWSSSSSTLTEAFAMYCEKNNTGLFRSPVNSMKNGFSVRCIKE